MQSLKRDCSQPLQYRNWVMRSKMGSPFFRGVPQDFDAAKLEENTREQWKSEAHGKSGTGEEDLFQLHRIGTGDIAARSTNARLIDCAQTQATAIVNASN